ncbi:hypothetical protein [Streptomyces sp. NPDC000983]|uniref:hypothetical protein n=1 Tax=Streptomyces sp. NPDC000983 TaxID=3154373 RepID=UPI00332DD1F5
MHRNGTTLSRRTRTTASAAVTAAAVTALVWSSPWADGTASAEAATSATALSAEAEATPRLAEARHRFQALPKELRDDIRELRGLSATERRERATEIRDKALSGAYGEGVRRWAERRSDFWRAD